MLPCFAFKQLIFYIGIGKNIYFGTAFYKIHFGFTKITDSDLNDFRNLLYLSSIIHNGSMRMFKTFVGFSQIHVSVQMQNAKIVILTCQSLIIPVWCRVVAAKQNDSFALIYPIH